MNKIHYYDSILSPFVTEKATTLSENNKIVFTSGLLKYIQSPEALIGVLAHEIGHIIVGEKNGRETHFGGRKDLMSRGGCGTNITKEIIDLSSQNFMNYSKFVFKK